MSIHPIFQFPCPHCSGGCWGNPSYTLPNIEELTPEFAEWKEIQEMAKTNETLRIQLDRVKILYYLSKKDGT